MNIAPLKISNTKIQHYPVNPQTNLFNYKIDTIQFSSKHDKSTPTSIVKFYTKTHGLSPEKRLKTIKKIVKHTPKDQREILLLERSKNNSTPLHYATRSYDQAKYILKASPDEQTKETMLNAMNDSGLMAIECTNNLKIKKLLYESSPNPETKANQLKGVFKSTEYEDTFEVIKNYSPDDTTLHHLLTLEDDLGRLFFTSNAFNDTTFEYFLHWADKQKTLDQLITYEDAYGECMLRWLTPERRARVLEIYENKKEN